jgi:hypothetical protein
MVDNLVYNEQVFGCGQTVERPITYIIPSPHLRGADPSRE